MVTKQHTSSMIGGTIVVGLLSFVVALTALSPRYFAPQADETFLAWTAKRVLLGEVPYRDYFSCLPPLLIYFVAGILDVVGASLGSLRIVTLAFAVGIACMLFWCFTRAGVPLRWAVGFSLLYPLVFFSFWPIASHHWIACGSATATLCLFVGTEDTSLGRYVLTGTLAGITFLTMQRQGAIVCALVLLHAICRSRRQTASTIAVLAPMVLLSGLTALLLGSQGALHSAWNDICMYTLRYYRQEGGFNDAGYCVSFLSLLGEAWKAGRTADAPGFHTWMAVIAMLAPAWGLISLSAAEELRRRPVKLSGKWVESFGGFIAIMVLVLFSGRSDLAHISFCAPYLLVVCLASIDWQEEILRPRLWQAWMVTLLGLAVLHWSMILYRTPPSFREVFRVDEMYKKSGVGSHLPPDLPLLYLPHGSELYFFQTPLRPPVDWLLPPSFRCHAPWEYDAFADYALRNKVPYVLIERAYASAFVQEPSAVRDLLRTHYRLLQQDSNYVLYGRL